MHIHLFTRNLDCYWHIITTLKFYTFSENNISHCRFFILLPKIIITISKIEEKNFFRCAVLVCIVPAWDCGYHWSNSWLKRLDAEMHILVNRTMWKTYYFRIYFRCLFISDYWKFFCWILINPCVSWLVMQFWTPYAALNHLLSITFKTWW